MHCSSPRDTGAEQSAAYRCPYPKYEFLNYFVADLGYLLHGSRKSDITVFEPRPAADIYQFWAQHAATAASDGGLSMELSIRDRRPRV